jgi:hypothetical protein
VTQFLLLNALFMWLRQKSDTQTHTGCTAHGPIYTYTWKYPTFRGLKMLTVKKMSRPVNRAGITWSSKMFTPIPLTARSKTARFLGLRVRIPLKAWMFVSCECYVLLQVERGLCEEPITNPGESYWVRMCRVWSRQQQPSTHLMGRKRLD